MKEKLHLTNALIVVINGKNKSFSKIKLILIDLKLKMCITFFKWVQYLQRRDITKFLSLYSNECILIPRVEPSVRESLINPYPNDLVLHNRVGAYKKFENIFFCPYREFNILDHKLTTSDNKENIYAQCKFYYRGSNYQSNHNITLSKDNYEDKIIYHASSLKKINEL